MPSRRRSRFAPAGARRGAFLVLAPLALAACSLATTIPDLTSGGGDAGDAGLADGAEAGDGARLCTQTFTYDPKGRTLTTVHVAGAFNAWPKTIAGGGWPLAKVGGVWTGSHTLPPGRYAYKFVLDENEFVPDPSNPVTEPDGFGGKNSVLDVGCGE